MAKKANHHWFLGIDLGTGSCKTVVVDEKARVLGFGTGDYTGTTTHERWEEQDPGALLSGMIRAVRSALSNAGSLTGNCNGISIGGALHSVVAVDHSGNPLTGVITWADNRATGQAMEIRATPYAGDLYRQTGCPVHPMYPVYKIKWIREKLPGIFSKAAKFLSAKEYVFSQLTGHYAVDYCLAAGSGLLNTHTLSWNGSSLELAGINESHLSSLCDPCEMFLGLKPELASQMGISPDTPVVLGSSDAANSSLGAGAVSPWQATCMVGTSGALRIISPKPLLDARSRTWCYAIDRERWLVGGAINNGGIAVSWLQDLLRRSFPGLPLELEKSLDDLVSLAGQAGIGAGGVICLPFFAGERSPNWNLNARASFFGLALHHRTEHLVRSLLEGIAFRLRSVHDVLSEITPDVGQIRASGGFIHSPLWLQIVSDVLNRELVVPVLGETSSLGAAFWAMVGSGVCVSVDQAGSLVPMGAAYVPDRNNVEPYERLYRVYQDLYGALSPLFDRIVPFQENS
jgi:gluconokinase